MSCVQVSSFVTVSKWARGDSLSLFKFFALGLARGDISLLVAAEVLQASSIEGQALLCDFEIGSVRFRDVRRSARKLSVIWGLRR